MLTFTLWLVVLTGAHAVSTDTNDPEPPAPMTVMTFNLRYASEEGENRWSDRRSAVVDVIRESNPDLIGTQEGLYEQLRDLERALPHYRWIGLGRRGGSADEHMAVFYRTERFEPLAYDHFWLAETPDRIGSRSFDADLPRMVTWVRFEDRRAGRRIELWNTHLDHRSQHAREEGAKLLLQRIDDRREEVPLVLTGDFNAPANDHVHRLLTADGALADTFDFAARPGPEHGTFHGFAGVPLRRGRIDWILTRGAWTCERVAIVTEAVGGRYPSDHFPVIATLRVR